MYVCKLRHGKRGAVEGVSSVIGIKKCHAFSRPKMSVVPDMMSAAAHPARRASGAPKALLLRAASSRLSEPRSPFLSPPAAAAWRAVFHPGPEPGRQVLSPGGGGRPCLSWGPTPQPPARPCPPRRGFDVVNGRGITSEEEHLTTCGHDRKLTFGRL